MLFNNSFDIQKLLLLNGLCNKCKPLIGDRACKNCDTFMNRIDKLNSRLALVSRRCSPRLKLVYNKEP